MLKIKHQYKIGQDASSQYLKMRYKMYDEDKHPHSDSCLTKSLSLEIPRHINEIGYLTGRVTDITRGQNNELHGRSGGSNRSK